MTRPIMGRDELAQHKAGSHGRDYTKSCDGYDDMDVAAKQKWRPVSGWGRDGWDLGDLPYVVIFIREQDGQFQMQQVVEGDHDVYEFSTEEDRSAAIDYLFLWYAAPHSWSPITETQRAALDACEITVDDKFRGPFSWSNNEKESK